MLKNKFLIRKGILFLISINIFLMSACSNKTDEPSLEGSQDLESIENTTQETSTQVQSVQESENISPVSGGELNIPMRVPKTLNPLLNGDVTVDNVLKLVFEPLFNLDTDQRVIPCIANSYSLSADGLSLTVNIKSNISWHDGTVLSAKDVVYSLDAIKSAPKSLYKNALVNVTGYKAKDKNTVVINYSKPYGAVMYNLCFPVIPSHYYLKAKTDVSFKPLGSGFYKFSSYELAKEMILEKATTFRGTPYIDKVKVIITDNRQTDINTFEQGLTDVIAVDVSQYGKFGTDKRAKSTKINTNNFEFLGYNFNNPVFQNLNIRKALAYSIPIKEVTETIYLSYIDKSLVPINPTSWLSAGDKLPYYEQNLQTAVNYIQASRFTKQQLTFKILVNAENTERVETANIIATSLNQIGMNVSVDKQPFDKYMNLLAADNFNMYLGGTSLANTADLTSLLASFSKTGTGINYMNYSDSQMDLLLGQASNAIGEENYKNINEQVQKYIVEQLPLIGIGFKNTIVLTDSRIHGENRPLPNNFLNTVNEWFIKE